MQRQWSTDDDGDIKRYSQSPIALYREKVRESEWSEPKNEQEQQKEKDWQGNNINRSLDLTVLIWRSSYRHRHHQHSSCIHSQLWLSLHSKPKRLAIVIGDTIRYDTIFPYFLSVCRVVFVYLLWKKSNVPFKRTMMAP